MIAQIKVTARSASMEEAEREIEVFLNHARMAGYVEGIAPQSSSWTDNHFQRVNGSDSWVERGMPFAGRVTMTFDPDGPFDGGMLQHEHEVYAREDGASLRSAVRALLSVGVNNVAAGDERALAAYRLVQDLLDGERDATQRVIVLARARPVTRFDHGGAYVKGDPWEPLTEDALAGSLAEHEPSSWDNLELAVAPGLEELALEILKADGPLGYAVRIEVVPDFAPGEWCLRGRAEGAFARLEATSVKPSAADLVAFAELASRVEVTQIAFGPARSRPGFEIDLCWCKPVVGPFAAGALPVSIGGNQTIYAEAFGDAVAAANAAIDAAGREVSVSSSA